MKALTGAQVPLGRLARIALTTGPAMIRDDDGPLAAYDADASTADIGDTSRAPETIDRR